MLSRKDLNIYLVDITVHLDILGYSIVLPIIASLAISMGGNEDHTSYLFASYAVMQFISYIYMGKLSDIYGRKPMIVLSLIGSSIGAILQGFSSNIWALITFRALTGLFAGSWIVAQAYIADVTTCDERSKYITRLEAFLAAAYIFGPALGGFLEQITLSTPLFVAGIVAGAALLIVIPVLRESLDITKLHLNIEQKSKKKVSKKEMFTPTIIICMIVEFCNRWQINGWDSYFNTYALNEYNLSILGFSFLVTAMGIISCILNGFVYPYFVFKLNIPIVYLSIVSGVLLLIANIVIACSSNLVGAIIGSILMEMGYNFSTPAPSSIISTESDSSYQGEILSYNMMAGQIAMIFSPVAMAQLSKVKPNIPFFVSGFFGAMITVCMFIISLFPGGLHLGRSAKNEQGTEKKEIEIESAEKKMEKEDAVIVPIENEMELETLSHDI